MSAHCHKMVKWIFCICTVVEIERIVFTVPHYEVFLKASVIPRLKASFDLV